MHLALSEVQLGPQCTMLKECSKSTTAYEGGPETILLGRDMGGDEGKNLQRDAVYGNEGIPPLADGGQHGRCIPVELTNFAEGEAIEKISVPSSHKTSQRSLSRRTTENGLRASAPHSERRRAVKGTGPFQGELVCP